MNQRIRSLFAKTSLAVLCGLLPSWVLSGQTPTNEAVIARAYEAHGAAHWWKTQAFQSEITVTFGGSVGVDGTMTYQTNGPRARLDLKDGSTVVFDGTTAWLAPEGFEFAPPGARFHVLTWPWFSYAPFKLDGPGVILSEFETVTTQQGTHWLSRQSFEAGTGDAPDDWYDLFINPETGRLDAMGYIVTYYKSVEVAEEKPHAILYHDYVRVGGALVSTRWTFTLYDAQTHEFSGDLGEVVLRNPRLIDVGDDFFTRPGNATEEKLPGN
ncbi:MAG: hypothetical protein ACFBZ8_08490 [Opitutales bacterium]